MNRNYLYVLILMAAFMPGWGVAQEAEEPEDTKRPAVRADLLVSDTWLADNLNAPNVAIVHVGADIEGYREGHIPGARYLELSEIAVEKDGLINEIAPLETLTEIVRRLGIDENSRIVLYDADGGLIAARAFVTFDYLGMGDRTALLDGHLKHWINMDRPVSKDEPNVTPTTFTPKPNPEVIIAYDAVQKYSIMKTRHPDTPVALLDSRPLDQYTGEEPGRDVTRGGHIPGARHLYWQECLVEPSDPLLRPIEELQELYENTEVRPDDLVVTYCRSGGQASQAYFVSKYLGYNVKLYDGSFLEWSSKDDTKVETGE